MLWTFLKLSELTDGWHLLWVACVITPELSSAPEHISLRGFSEVCFGHLLALCALLVSFRYHCWDQMCEAHKPVISLFIIIVRHYILWIIVLWCLYITSSKIALFISAWCIHINAHDIYTYTYMFLKLLFLYQSCQSGAQIWEWLSHSPL